jgi:Flp pilus assembly protein TadG
MKQFTVQLIATIVGLTLVFGIFEGTIVFRTKRTQRAAEAGMRVEIQENSEGVQDMQKALSTEIQNISDVAVALDAKSTGQTAYSKSLHLGLAVLALTDANWRAASSTGALASIKYAVVERYAAAYFEQARLAQLQTTTLDSMMLLQAYVGRGDRLSSLTPQEARAAQIQAQLLLAHLRTMSRMTVGVEDAYKSVLAHYSSKQTINAV